MSGSALQRKAPSASRSLLWMALDASPDAIFLTTLDDPRIVDCNDGACRALGYAREELIGAPTAGLFAQRDTATLQKEYARLRTEATPGERIEAVHRRKDGSVFPVEIVRQLVRNAEGDFVLGIARDVSKRHRAENALRESEARFRALTEETVDWTWELDAGLRFTRIDGAGLAAVGIIAEDVIGRAALDIPSYRLLSPTPAEFAALRAARKPYRDVRGRFLLPDGSVHHVSVTGAPRFAADGSFLGYRGVTRNITAQALAEAALQESEARFRLLIESTPELHYFVTDPDRTAWNYASPGLSAIWGYDGAEGDPASLLALQRRAVHPEDRPAFGGRRALEAAGGRTDIEYRIEHARKGQRWLRTRTAGVAQPDGGVRVYGVTEDVTERKRAELALRESEERFRNIIESSPQILFFITNPDRSRWDYVSPSIERLWGFRGTATGSNRLTTFLGAELHPKDRDLFFGREARERNGELVDITYRVGLPGRGLRWLRTSTYGVSLPDASTRVYGTTIDVTAQKLAEEKLRELAVALEKRVERRTQELDESDRELDALAYAVSHDMRAPLRAINGFARLLSVQEDAALSEEGRRLLARIEANALAMGRQIDQVLAYSQTTRRAMQVETVDLEALAQDAVRRLAPDGSATVTIEALGEVKGDAAMLRVVLANLIENALKFAKPGVPAAVRLGVTGSGAAREWFVQDAGIGFDPQYAGKLFTLFTRLDQAAAIPGIGAGLAIVKRLVERHGGTVRAESSPGEGSSFSFILGEAPLA